MRSFSLLACFALAALWVRSYWVFDRLDVARNNSAGLDGPGGWWTRRRLMVMSGRGLLAAEWVSQGEARTGPLGGMDPPGVTFERRASRATDRWPPRTKFNAFDERLGFYFAWRRPYPYGERCAVAFPLALPVAAAAVPPLLVCARRLRDGARAKRGRCVRCRYDLRATPGRCPECGTIAAPAEPAGA